MDINILVVEAGKIINNYYKDLLQEINDNIPHDEFNMSSISAINNESFFYCLFMIDAYLARYKCNVELRRPLFDNNISNYIANCEIINMKEFDSLINNRLDQYGVIFNSKPSGNIDEITRMHCQLLLKAYKSGINSFYIHGESAVETDLLLFSLIEKAHIDVGYKLIESLGKLKNILIAQPNNTGRKVFDRTLNAHFCHDTLPAILFKGKESTLQKIFSKPLYTLGKLWEFSANTLKKSTDDNISISIKEMDHIKVILIDLPKPMIQTDCYYVAIAFNYIKRLFSIKFLSIHYYTLELGLAANLSSKTYFVCGWKDGNTHVNYYEQPNEDKKQFLSYVFELSKK